MRMPLFIPLVILTIFSALMMLRSFDTRETWKIALAVVAFLVLATLSIVSILALLRRQEEKESH